MATASQHSAVLEVPAPSVGAPSLDRQFSTGDLVDFNGYRGKVCGYVGADLVSVSFGRGRFRAIPEEQLSVFVPWWSDRD